MSEYWELTDDCGPNCENRFVEDPNGFWVERSTYDALRERHGHAQNALAEAVAESERNRELLIAAEAGWDACSTKLRDAATRCEQAEAQVAMLCSGEPCPKCG